jgi:hypothetical protein
LNKSAARASHWAAVKNPPRFSLSRALGVAVLLAAWLTLSNHCALATLGHGAAGARSAELHKCCAGKAPAEKEKAPSPTPGMCCKSLRVLPTDAPTKLVAAHTEVLLFEFMWTAPTAATSDPVVAERACAAGPPEAVGFVERVLQRSLLSHAPPPAA